MADGFKAHVDTTYDNTLDENDKVQAILTANPETNGRQAIYQWLNKIYNRKSLMNELGQLKTFFKSISEFSRLFLSLKESGFYYI